MKIKTYSDFLDYKSHFNESKAFLDSFDVNELCDTKAKIEYWLHIANINRYFINKNLTVDVNTDVLICPVVCENFKDLTKIPFKFNNVDYQFRCMNCSLTTLENTPNYVGDYFSCTDNKLTNLEYMPRLIKAGISCTKNLITSLEGIPDIINGGLHCNDNKLTSLEYCPRIIKADFNFRDNPIENLYGISNLEYIEGSIFPNNTLKSIDGIPDTFDLETFSTFEYKNILNLIWTWLETNLSTDPSLIKYNIKWIKEHKDTMPESFEKEFGYLLEIGQYNHEN